MMTNLSPLFTMPTKASGAQPTATGSTEERSDFDEALATAENEETARASSARERGKTLRPIERSDIHQGDVPVDLPSVPSARSEQEIIPSASSRSESGADRAADSSPAVARADAGTPPKTPSIHSYASSADSSKSLGVALSSANAGASADDARTKTASVSNASTRAVADSAAQNAALHRTVATASMPVEPRTTSTMPGRIHIGASQSASATHPRPDTVKNVDVLVGTAEFNSETPGETLTATNGGASTDELVPQPTSLSRSDALPHREVRTTNSPLSATRVPDKSDQVSPMTSGVSAAPSAPQPTAPTAPAAAPVVHTPRAALVSQLVPALLTVAQAGEGTHQFTVTVSPENLGPVTVRAHIAGGSLLIELFSPSDIGRDAVRHILSDLRRDLAGVAPHASLNLASGDAPTSQSGPQGFSGGSHNQQQSFDQRANAGGREEGDGPPSESQRRGLPGDAERPSAPVPQPPLHPLTTIDVFV